MAKTYRFTKQQMRKALADSRGFRSHAARVLHCSPTTITNYIERYPDLQEVLDDTRAEFHDLAEAKLIEAIGKGEPWSICFYLKHNSPIYSERMKMELSGPNGSPIQTAVQIYIPDNQRATTVDHASRLVEGGNDADSLPD